MSKLKSNILLISLLIFGFALLQGCVGSNSRVVYTDEGSAYKLEEVYSVGLFTPTWQYKRASECEVEEKLIKTTNHGSGYTTRSVKNCKRIGTSADGYTPDTASPMGPALLQAGATAGAGALIGDGIRDSSDTINNTNQQGQLQGQQQGQIQKSYNYNRNSNVNKNSNCNGFFC